MRKGITLIIAAAFTLMLFVGTANADLIIHDPGQGIFNIANRTSTGLSGIVHIGGDQYLTVSDNQAGFFSLTISINSANGSISDALVGNFTQFQVGSDYEGIAYNPANASVFAAAEADSSIREFRISDGALLGSVSVPAVFTDTRPNKSLESLSYEAGQRTLWTANEEALTTDGEASSAGSGTTVRLQKFDETLNPAGQWAYVVDPATVDVLFPQPAPSFSGLTDLLLLPDEQLLALEREFGGPTVGIRNRIYGLDFIGATDTSAVTELDGGIFTPVGKTLLWEGNFEALDINNFEGIALGPTLDNGDYSLFLISDDQDNLFGESLYALTLSGVNPVPIPNAILLLGSGLIGLAVVRKRYKK